MRSDQTIEDLDEAIALEKRRAARDMQSETWADGTLEGIEPDILADAAIATALEEMIIESGEEAALVLMDAMRERLLSGEFTPRRHLH